MLLPPTLLGELPPGSLVVPTTTGFSLDGADGPLLVVRDRQHPLRRATAILETNVAEWLTSDEGQPVALGAPRTGLATAVVFADTWYRLLAAPIAHEGLLRRLAVSVPLGLARRRRRWYRYAPPPHWGGVLRHGLIAEWLAPGFPARRAMITVFPARPVAEGESSAVDRQIHELDWTGFVVASQGETTSIAGHDGLRGARWRFEGAWGDGPRTSVELAALADDTFSYVARLDHDGEDGAARSAVFTALVASIRALSAPAAARHDPADHYGE